MTDPLQRGITRLRDVDRHSRRGAVGAGQGELLGMGFSEVPRPLAVPLKKATQAVHSRSAWSAQQRKVFNALVLNAYDELAKPEVKIHRMPLQDLITLINFNSNNTAALKNSMRDLMTTQVEWNVIGERGGEVWEACTALASVTFRDGMCMYEFSHVLRQKLHHPERYAYLDLAEMRLLTLAPAVALYENATRFRKLGCTPWYPIETWRELLGAQAETYDDFRRFREKVITPAAAQVAEHTSISPVPEIMRDRKKVVAMRFTMSGPDCGKALPGEVVTEVDDVAALPGDASDLLKRLVCDFLLTAEQATEVIRKFGDAKVKEVADYAADRFAQGKVEEGKLAPYFLVVLTNWNPAPVKESGLVAKRREQHETKRKQANDSQRQQQLTAAFSPMYRGLSMQQFQQRSLAEQAQIESEFEQHLISNNNPLLSSWQSADTRDTQVVQALFRNFVAERLLPPRKQLLEAWLEADGAEDVFMSQVEILIQDLGEKNAAPAV